MPIVCVCVCKVLLAEPESAKALFRCGQLNLRLKNIEAAKVCVLYVALVDTSYLVVIFNFHET